MTTVIQSDLAQLSQLRDSLPQLEAELRRRQGLKLNRYYPDEGPLCRELYAKSMEHFAAGLEHRERLVLAANRVGKSEGMGGYEVALHLTGLYPHWWPGRKFTEPGEWFACNQTWADARDINQAILCGPPTRPEEWGTGLIPAEKVIRYIPNPHVKDGILGVLVRHASGGISDLQFKSYEPGYKAFMGRSKQGIWLDEEPDIPVYTECLLRTMTTGGMVIATFTPLKGRTPLIRDFLAQAVNREKLTLL